jgi:hypothetical protein
VANLYNTIIQCLSICTPVNVFIVLYQLLLKIDSFHLSGAIVAVIVWYLNLHLPMQSVPITTDVVGSNLDYGEVYNIM